MFTKLALKSLLDRKGSVMLTIMAMSVSVFVLLGVENVRYQAKNSFASSVSGTDLIVGARTSSLNLLLYSVFRIGSPTNNVRWESYQAMINNKNVKWSIPISLGDSHRGFRVMGTTTDYFQYFSFGKQRNLELAHGQRFNHIFDVVLGADVAKDLAYKLGDRLVLSHGIGTTSFSNHDDKPFTVVGILSPTGTAIDQTLHVSLEAIEAIHIDWQHGVKIPGREHDVHDLEKASLQPKSITAFLLGLESKMSIFQVQRAINGYVKEPLTAVLPGVVLSELWQTMSVIENTLLLISMLVFLAACLGVSAMLLSSIRERNHEIQLLRVIGAPPVFLFFLIEFETIIITLVSCVIGAAMLGASLSVFHESLASNFGIYVEVKVFTEHSFSFFLALISASIVSAMIPALRGYLNAKTLNG